LFFFFFFFQCVEDSVIELWESCCCTSHMPFLAAYQVDGQEKRLPTHYSLANELSFSWTDRGVHRTSPVVTDMLMSYLIIMPQWASPCVYTQSLLDA